ncbi:LysR family transcriptional regulator [Acidisoma cladoniae]|jgi:DNA-binding transcriptional LysR family regulator|uniref:LysR family transcriptional regulator n=1 Tax=Acidisoma cladoniae TaxID=3040935 RepID=UPI002551480E|nr:LysR family transcriptional regulator [Acidisoma sp. PAMC 29798]
MDLLAAFRCFVRVAETGSFSAVAREVGSTQPAISRQIAALEAHFDVRLIQRTTRSLTFTQDGQDLLAHARRVLETVEETEEILGKRRASPSGTVRIASSTAMARMHIIPRLPRLLQRYPQLEIEASISEQAQDLVAENLDLAIRAGAIADSSLVARQLGSTGRAVLVGTDYIEKHGEPQTPADLASHECIVYTGGFGPQRALSNVWEFGGAEGTTSVEVHGRFRSDSIEGISDAVRAGLGISRLPIWMFTDDIAAGRLKAILTDWQPPRVPIHAVYPSRRHLAPRVRAVIDFFVNEFRLDPTVSDYASI